MTSSTRDGAPLGQIEPPETLRRRFELASTKLSVAGRQYDLLRPRNIDDLISEEDFNLDDRIPYWAECWPSAQVLAERIARESGDGQRLLELGCGIGLVSVAAAQAGYRVLATDYYAEALEFTAANMARHGLRRLDTRLVDWRKLPRDLGRFDVVAASDVLYEKHQAALIAAAFLATLAPGGVGLLSDPGRRNAPGLIEECSKMGLQAQRVEQTPVIDAGTPLTISIFEIRRTAELRAEITP